MGGLCCVSSRDQPISEFEDSEDELGETAASSDGKSRRETMFNDEGAEGESGMQSSAIKGSFTCGVACTGGCNLHHHGRRSHGKACMEGTASCSLGTSDEPVMS